MKLAMAVGTDRHSVIGRIVPRHFEQTAEQARMPIADVRNVIQELLRVVPDALQSTPNKYAKRFAF
jgi:serine/threonine-protein kinase HipA